jgi:adenylyltransferase/sulfurtransferase
MANTILIPTALRQFTLGKSELAVEAANVKEALEKLVAEFPELSKHLYNDRNAVRSFINIYVNEDNIRHQSGLETPLASNDSIMIVPSIAGGR